jgi:predicted DNA-binding transcriptional regulator AlpA
MKNANEGLGIERRSEVLDRVIWRRELQAATMVSSETVRRWMRDGKLPSPDVALSHRTKGWRMSTLRAAGINLVM